MPDEPLDPEKLEQDLEDQLSFVRTLWRAGIEMLWRGRQVRYEMPTDDELIAVLDPSLDDIADHLEIYRINMRSFDCNKMVNYVAWHTCNKPHAKYDPFPLFFAHLCFIDDTVSGVSLFSIPHLAMIAENMRIFHQKGHKLAPYTFFKGVDLTFSFCCGLKD